jgi:hypothetical protein
MLDLSAELSREAHTYFVPVEYTRFARERVGEGALWTAPRLCGTCVGVSWKG